MRTKSEEYAAVIKLANCYAATHVKGKKKTFISARLEADVKVARAAAKLFAEDNKIFCDDAVHKLSQPIITVLKCGERWFPAELHADEVILLTAFGPRDLGGSQQEAVRMANVIALSRNWNSIPSIGISLEK
jgi:hypothetical protein